MSFVAVFMPRISIHRSQDTRVTATTQMHHREVPYQSQESHSEKGSVMGRCVERQYNDEGDWHPFGGYQSLAVRRLVMLRVCRSIPGFAGS